jgi:hypothetical protein
MFNNGPKLVTQGLNLLVDAADPTSYPGTGTIWRDVVGGQNGIISGSVTYTSSFYGGLVFSGPTASVIFPTSSANFGSGSFTVELAFRPARIEGIHYLVSKNSGSFPNWGIYLSGSGGSGKLFSEFRISSTISCSVSSSTTFVTGSNYDVSVRMVPGSSGSGIYVDGISLGGVLGNGGGSLTSTGSLLIGNIAVSSSQSFSGSLFATKIYSINSLTQPSQNYNAIAPRLSKLPTSTSLPTFELLVIAGGGSGGSGRSGGGGGAGGLQYIPSYIPVIGNTTVIVGAGGNASNGQNSSIGIYTSVGGGRGGSGGSGLNGGSGGGGGGGATSGGSGSVGQGNNGGNSTSTSQWTSGGGGGAGTAGNPNNGNTNSGAGGSGSFIASFAAIGGSPAGWFAGGGGGGTDGSGGAQPGSGSMGGGGTGGFGVGVAGVTGSVNTGGGGGGSGNSSTPGTGGSGIVAIRYSGAPIALGGEITQSSGFTYHVFRTTGTSSFTLF